jgi:hypothetical protein
LNQRQVRRRQVDWQKRGVAGIVPATELASSWIPFGLRFSAIAVILAIPQRPRIPAVRSRSAGF